MNAKAARYASTGEQPREQPRNIPTRQDLRRQLEQQQRENQRLREQLAERDRKIADGEKQLGDAEKQIADAEKQIADLERQLAGRRKNSANSSKPPSSDGVAVTARPRRKNKTGRKPGGQKGHPGHHRSPVPATQVQQVCPVLPEACKHCGEALPQSPEQIRTEGEPQRHQVTELPPIQPFVIEYQCPKVLCPACGKGTRAPLPAEAQGDFGPQLLALVAYLTIVCRMPRRVVELFLEQGLGITMSLGSAQNGWEQSSAAVAGPCAELEGQLKNEPVLNCDETGWRNNGQRRYLWVLVASQFAVFTIARTRSSEVLLDLLGAVFAGILCNDRFGAYFKYHKGKAQLCWAHLKRDILGIRDFAKTGDAERFARDALALYASLFRLWHKFKSGMIVRQQLIERSIRLQKRWFALAGQYLDSDDRAVCNLAMALYKHCDKLFTFIECSGVEPTNNVAERTIRIAVQLRKIVFGNRSAEGELAMARLLTVSQTCRMQGRNTLDYLKEAILCHRRHQPAPSLLPRQ